MIRSAEGGTLFLDEIGEIGRDLQPKLLRFLETGEVQPLGEAHPVRTNVRIVAATNQDLGQLVHEGRFRDDLFFRLNISIPIPPLRDRREEIPELAEVFSSASPATSTRDTSASPTRRWSTWCSMRGRATSGS